MIMMMMMMTCLGMFLLAEHCSLEAGEQEGDQPGEAHHQPREATLPLKLQGQEGTTDGNISRQQHM